MVHKQSTDGEDADTYLHMVLDLSNPYIYTPLEDSRLEPEAMMEIWFRWFSFSKLGGFLGSSGSSSRV